MRWVAILAACLVCFPLGIGIYVWLSIEAVSVHEDPPQVALAVRRPKDRLSESAFIDMAQEIRQNPSVLMAPSRAKPHAHSVSAGVASPRPVVSAPMPAASQTARRSAHPLAQPTSQLPLADRIDALAVDLRNKIANTPKAIAARAREMIRAGKIQEALTLLDRGLARHPKSFELLVARADACTAEGNYTDAVVAYGRAVRIRDDDAGVWFNYAVSLTRNHRFTPAADAYNTVLKLMPNHLKATYNLATIYQSQGKLGRALDLWKKTTAALPKLPAPWFHRGTIHLDFEQYEEAMRCFEQVTRLEPGNPAAWRNLGLALLGVEDFGRAVTALEKTVSLDSGKPADLAALGRAYWFRYLRSRPRNPDDRTAAIDRLRKALAINPNHPAARKMLDEIFDAKVP